MPGFEYGSEYTLEPDIGSFPARGEFLNMGWLTDHLNEMAQQGWRLHSFFEQGSWLRVVFERPTS